MSMPQDLPQIAAGATATAAGVGVTWMEVANQYIDMGAGLIGIVAGILTCIWTVKRIREKNE